MKEWAEGCLAQISPFLSEWSLDCSNGSAPPLLSAASHAFVNVNTINTFVTRPAQLKRGKGTTRARSHLVLTFEVCAISAFWRYLHQSFVWKLCASMRVIISVTSTVFWLVLRFFLMDDSYLISIQSCVISVALHSGSQVFFEQTENHPLNVTLSEL